MRASVTPPGPRGAARLPHRRSSHSVRAYGASSKPSWPCAGRPSRSRAGWSACIPTIRSSRCPTRRSTSRSSSSRGPGPGLPLSGALPQCAADGPVSRQRRRVGRDVATGAGSSGEGGTGRDREGIDGTSPSGVETLARCGVRVCRAADLHERRCLDEQCPFSTSQAFCTRSREGIHARAHRCRVTAHDTTPRRRPR